MNRLRNGRPRVVVTGMGALTPLGDFPQTWESLLAGQSGIRRIQGLEVSDLSVQIAGQIPNFDPTQQRVAEYKELRRMGRASQLTLVATQMAWDDSGLSLSSEQDAERVAVVVGTSLGNYEVGEENIFRFRLERHKRPNPTALMNALPNFPAHYVSRFFHALGPLLTPSTACATGTQALGIGADMIRNGQADVVIAGGVDAILQDYIIAGFSAMHALTRDYNDCPEKASRPFDKNRSGFVISEGVGILILEKLSHALRRGATIYGEIVGHASSADAYHAAALEPSGQGAARSMRWALADARLSPQDIQYINAHGTSTPLNDSTETKAIKTVFGAHAYNLAVNSTKSMIGHTLSAAGAIEAMVCLMSLKSGMLHPTINYESVDPDCDLDYVPNCMRECRGLRYALSNSFGLGGQNASIILGSL